jgi:hypothetical protein
MKKISLIFAIILLSTTSTFFISCNKKSQCVLIKRLIKLEESAFSLDTTNFFSSFDFYKFLFFFIPGLKRKATLEIKKITSAHLNVLRVKRMQKLRKDDYGKLIEKDWMKEIKYFHLNTITLNSNCFYGSKFSTDEIYHLVNLEIDLFESTQPLTEQDVANLSPVAFEAYCARVLNENGW